MIDQAGVDMLAQGVARQVHLDTGINCGWGGKIDRIGKRIIFVYRLLASNSVQEVLIADLERAHSWQSIFEAMVKKALEDNAPWALAKKLAIKAENERLWGSSPPDIAPSIDEQGRRHHRMFCETGVFNFKDKASDQDDEGTAPGPQG